MRGKLLGFDLLLGVDAMKALGGVVVGPKRSAQIGDGKVTICADISINKRDFTATFDYQNRIWTAAWKWSEDCAPEGMKNGVSEYTVAAKI